MNFAQFSVTRPVAVTMRIAALVLLGAICLTRLPIDLLPRITLPTVVVVTNWPNVAPEEIEAQVTRPIEQAVSSVPNLYQVNSSTSEGVSSVRVQLQWGVDSAQAAAEVRQLVERARQRFPIDPTLQSPLVYRFDPSQLPILIYGVSGERDPVKLRTLIDNQIAPILESSDGVASAIITGGQQRAIMVQTDPEKLRAYHLSLSDITKRIAQENVNLPAGIARQSDTEFTIRSSGWFKSVKEIENIPVGSYNGQLVMLHDVATIVDGNSETRLFTRLNGEPAVGVIITKQSESNTVKTAQNVQEKVRQIEKMYPTLKFGLAYDQSKFIEGSIHEVSEAALIGGVLAVLILLFFLRNFRSTLVVALSIPISITSTFALLYIGGFTINTMSLGGLALATGLIVDDAVVVLENIFRHIERDKKRAAEAAVSGTNEIASAVVASTLTIIVVFLPLLLIKGQAGQMFAQFALVVIFSIAVSLLDATTVVPMLAARLIQGDAHHEDVEDGHKRGPIEWLFHKFGQWLDALDALYRNGLRWTLKHRFPVIIAAVTVSLATFLLVPYIGTELMPPSDSGDFSVMVKLPVGTALEKTDKTVKEIERILMANPNVQTAFSASGTTLSLRGTTTSLTPHLGSVTVKLKEHRKQSTQEVMGDLRKEFGKLPATRALANQTDLVTMFLTGGNQGIEMNIFGADLTTLSNLSKDVMARIRAIPGLENVDVNWQEATPEMNWNVDRDKAQQLGLSFSDIAGAISTATNGTIASYYQEQGFQYPILVQLPEDRRKTVAALLNLPIRSTANLPVAGAVVGSRSRMGIAGRDVTLREVAAPAYGVGPSEISRINRQRYIAIFGQPQNRPQSEIQTEISKAMKDMPFPPGYYWDWGTNQKRQQEEFSGLWLAVALAIALIYMLLASQFESFIHPLTVLTSVPLSAVGVALALFLTGKSFGLTAFIGLLMLVGIVVKNGILLVDYTNALRSRGMERNEAVLTAGPTRLRPILMTTAAAILGMLPLAIGMGNGSSTQAPMATAVIGGLTTSTFLTLFIVPTVYTLFDDIARFFRRDKIDLAPAVLVEPTVEAIESAPIQS